MQALYPPILPKPRAYQHSRQLQAFSFHYRIRRNPLLIILYPLTVQPSHPYYGSSDPMTYHTFRLQVSLWNQWIHYIGSKMNFWQRSLRSDQALPTLHSACHPHWIDTEQTIHPDSPPSQLDYKAL